MDPFTAVAAAGLLALVGAAAAARSDRQGSRPVVLPVRVRRRRRG